MTNTNGPATATVETLRAEVRVLQVGSRQITMSVVKQLDHVEIDEIEVFGRIKMADWSRNSVELIGRSTKTGALVRSWASGHPGYGNVSAQRYAELEALPLIVLAGLR